MKGHLFSAEQLTCSFQMDPREINERLLGVSRHDFIVTPVRVVFPIVKHFA